MKQNKKFQRQCCACKSVKQKEELIRITINSKTKELQINENNEVQGRSVYICKNIECIEKALKYKKIGVSLKSKVPETIKEELCNLLQN